MVLQDAHKQSASVQTSLDSFYFILFYFFGLTNPVKPLGHCLDTELALGSLCWEVCINRRSAVSVLLLH